RLGEDRFHRAWPGVVDEPFNLAFGTKSLLKPAFALSRERVGDEPLRMGDIGKMSDTNFCFTRRRHRGHEHAQDRQYRFRHFGLSMLTETAQQATRERLARRASLSGAGARSGFLNRFGN